MRNAGDLTTAADLYAPFQTDALQAATTLRLPLAMAAFSLQLQDLEARYFGLFDGVCDELRGADGALPEIQAS
jgi:hypothetical protein